MFACETLYIKKRHALSRNRQRRSTCSTLSARELLKTLPSHLSVRLFSLCAPLSLFPHSPTLKSIIVEHRSRRVRYKCPSLSGTRNPQQFPSCLTILPVFSAPLLPVLFLSFLRSCPKLNTLESERLNLSAITRSFPSSSIKASQDGSGRLGRAFERRLIPPESMELIYPRNQSLHACASA